MQNTYNTMLTFPTSVIVTQNIVHTSGFHTLLYSTNTTVAVLTRQLQYLHRSYSTTFSYFLLGYTYTTYIPVLLFCPPPIVYDII